VPMLQTAPFVPCDINESPPQPVFLVQVESSVLQKRCRQPASQKESALWGNRNGRYTCTLLNSERIDFLSSLGCSVFHVPTSKFTPPPPPIACTAVHIRCGMYTETGRSGVLGESFIFSFVYLAAEAISTQKQWKYAQL
jgi:hypothetical protein